jgi:hypothetical protein
MQQRLEEQRSILIDDFWTDAGMGSVNNSKGRADDKFTLWGSKSGIVILRVQVPEEKMDRLEFFRLTLESDGKVLNLLEDDARKVLSSWILMEGR